MADKQLTKDQRLGRSIENSYRELYPFREHFKSHIREYVGNRYARGGAKKPVFINLLAFTADVYTMVLAGNMPRCSLSVQIPDLRPMANRMALATNNLAAAIRFDETVQEIIRDAFLCVGIRKVLLADGLEMELAPDRWVDPGRPYMGRVSPMNWVHDMSVEEWGQIKFCGDRYRVPFEVIRNDQRFDKAKRELLKPNSKYPFSDDIDGTERAHAISYGYETDMDEYEPMTDLWDIYCPYERKVKIFNHNWTVKLGEVDYDEGPDFGPYDLLWFNSVPDNTMPSSPVSQLRELHDLINRIYRKISRQTGRAKQVFVYEGGAEDDAKRILDTDDGYSCQVNNRDAVGIMQFGGADQVLSSTLVHAMQIYNDQAGNVQALAGLGPQADTATQEQIVSGAVSAHMAKKQVRVEKFTSRCFRDLGYLLWQHPTLHIPATYDAGSGVQFNMDWRPDIRRGQFHDYTFDVVTHSMAYQSPQQRLQKVMEYIQTTVMPALPMIEQQGGRLNWHKLNRMVAEESNTPEINELIEWAQPLLDRPFQAAGATHNSPPKPPVTTRNVVRSSRPGMTNRSAANAVIAQSSQQQDVGMMTPAGVQ